jgi:biopolymer transport protein ExbD
MPGFPPSQKRPKEEEGGDINITSLMDAFTIILVFLIKQFGSSAVEVSEGYRPPVADTRLEVDRIIPLQVRQIGPEAISYAIGDKPQKAERKDPSLGYAQLRADLKAEKPLVDAAIADEDLKGAINIVCDKSVTYSTLMDVMKSVAGSGFFKLKLVAEP